MFKLLVGSALAIVSSASAIAVISMKNSASETKEEPSVAEAQKETVEIVDYISGLGNNWGWL